MPHRFTIPLLLASNSPRRRELFEAMGLNFRVQTAATGEHFPAYLKGGDIALHIVKEKAEAASVHRKHNELLVAADTVVWHRNEALNKPTDLADAARMLRQLSGGQHEVFTAVALLGDNYSYSFVERTSVIFHPISDAEIEHYLHHHRPLDKAGAYGIQEFIGLLAIARIEGDFYNVMGFPMQRFWRVLDDFVKGNRTGR